MQLNTLADLVLQIHSQPVKNNFLNYLKQSSWINLSNKEFSQKIYLLAKNLKKLGIKKGDTVALFADSSPYWLICDLGCQLIGAITVPMFTNVSKENLKFQLEHSKVKYAFVIGGDKWQIIKKYSENFKYIFTHELKVQNKKAIPISKFFGDAEIEHNLNFEKFLKTVKKDDLATIIYTSGSTGIPKGVCLTHNNLISQVKDAANIFPIDHRDIALSYLPLAHIFERMVAYFYLSKNMVIYFADEIGNVPDLMKETKPTIMTTVPRLLEKIHDKINTNITLAPLVKQTIAKTAICYAAYMPNYLKMILPFGKIFHRLIYKKLLAIFGGNMKIMISGGAALAPEIYSFFTNIGLNLYQAYGLTESSPGISSNTPKNHKIFSSGKPFPSVEIKISTIKDHEDDQQNSNIGEILAKGPNIMAGYFANETETKKTICNGWLKTGDLGYLDKDGYLFITGRIKELQKTSYGKYVPTNLLENKLKQIPFIENALTIVNGRKFVSAILFPDNKLIKEQKITIKKLNSIIDINLEKLNNSVNSWETIKKFHLAKTSPTIENGELTPSLKLRKHIIEENYKNVIAQFYKE